MMLLSNWLYVLIMSRSRFRVNLHSIVAWISRNSMLEAGAKFRWLQVTQPLCLWTDIQPFSQWISFFYELSVVGSNPVAVTYTTLYSYRDQASYLSQQLVLASKFQCDLRDTVGCCRKWLVHFNAGKSQLCLTGLITQVLLMWKWMGLFLRKNILLRWWDCLSLLNWAGPLRLSPFLKLPPRILSLYFDL